ncbi:MAG TPA: phosphonate ABC transporter, permease protein PhnE [Chloroflexia bacterium]|nr:phosphonate ABC transporter, permease protein PhnE [Chloroflexia bacterium]
MKEYTGNEKLTTPDLNGVEKEELNVPEADAVMPSYTPALGLVGRFRQNWRKAGVPKYRDPKKAALLQIIPGAGYVYMWKWGSAILTLFLFFLSYVILGLRFLQFTPDELEKRKTPIQPNPEPDLWNWSVLTLESKLLVIGLLALLILNLMGRTYKAAQLNNLNLNAKSVAELRKARGTWLDNILYFNYLAAVVVILGLMLVVKDAEVDLGRLVSKLGNIGQYISGLLSPAWDALWTPKGIMFRARETLEISIIGTLLGAVFAIPLSLLAARNLMGRNPITNLAYYIVRIILSIVRSIPTLFLAIIFVVSVGVGPFPAVLALTIFSAGLMTKLFSEAIEAIDWGQVEAISAAGGSPVHVVFFAVIPQVIPYFISHMLYCWEVNVHSAAVLGLVGAGGIGSYVQDAIETYKYANIGMALLVVIVITMSIDFTSAYIRSRIV